jgi:hypothetical protein
MFNKHPVETVNRLAKVQERLFEPEDRYFNIYQADRARGRKREKREREKTKERREL